ncbi:hypothetical protein P3T42_006237 [Paraburkholderia sp. GAS38]|jgi:hypothetical protein|uniref:hypothetical protein n=1 Tax=Paraburkholderia sp. GAS38 TaxID=3035133 RepID=UPI003D197022
MRFGLCLTRIGWLTCALVSGIAFAGPACNKQPVQTQSIEAIGRDMIVNGVPTSVVGIQAAGTPHDVSNEFREFWTREGVQIKAQVSPSGMLLSALDSPCLYVLSIPPQPDGARTRGLMSVIRLGGDPVSHQVPDDAIPLPEDGKTISDVESRDPGQSGRTWMIEMLGSARWNAQQYRSRLTAQGWSSVGLQPTYRLESGQSLPETAFAMQHRSDSLDASFSDRDGKTVAVINATRNR